MFANDAVRRLSSEYLQETRSNASTHDMKLVDLKNDLEPDMFHTLSKETMTTMRKLIMKIGLFALRAVFTL